MGAVRSITASLILGLALLACGTGPDDDVVTVFAAASLREALAEVNAEFERAEGIRVRTNVAGSGTLAVQIERGGLCDVFFSAGAAELDRLVASGDVDGASRRDVLTNSLVVVVPRGEGELGASELTGVARLSLANPDAVPAGRYARDWLRNVGHWDAVAPRVLEGTNVRAALAAVESGGAEAGVVYRTDAAISDGVDVAFAVPASEAPSIRYPAAATTASLARGPVRAYLEHLSSAQSLATFARFGFEAATGNEPSAAPRPVDEPPVSLADALTPLWISMKVALVATLIVLVPGLLAGYLLSRSRFFGKALVETLVELPLVLPPTAVGFLLLATLGRGGPLGRDVLPFDPALLFTWRAAAIAAAVMAFPLVVRTARVAFDQVDPRLERMASSLGMSRLEVARRVTLPMAKSGLLAAALLGFSRALGEFGATALIAGNIEGETRTLALAIFSDIQEGNDERARVLLVAAVALAFLSVALVGWLQRRATPERTEAAS